MQYRIKETGAVIEEQEFREMFPQVSLPAVLTPEVVSEYGADAVIPTSQPPITLYQTTTSKVELNKENKWELVWTIAAITDVALIASIKLSEEISTISQYKSSIQNLLDETARKNEYDNIISASLRAAYAGPFQEEGLAFATWMDACWVAMFKIISDAKESKTDLMSVKSMLALMPVIAIKTVVK